MANDANWLRINFVILFLGPILIMGAIKFLNSILPQKYYFSLSSLAKGSDEPFIIDTPSVSGQRLCSLLKKYGVKLDDAYNYIDQRTYNCSEVFANKNAVSNRDVRRKISKDVKDKIYRTAFASDQEAARHLQSDINHIIRGAMTDSELQNIVAEASSPSDAYKKILEFYTAQFASLSGEDTELSKFLKKKYGDLIPEAQQEENALKENREEADAENPKIAADDIKQIKRAHADFAATFLKTNYLSSYKGINASDIDEIVTGAGNYVELPSAVRNFYKGELTSDIDDALRSQFEKHGLSVLSNDSVRTAILTDVYRANLSNYVIAGLLRILPVFAVAFLFGIYFGRREVFSVAVAGALTALALVWPIILLWDNVVQGKWHDYKLTFIGIYAVYVLTYFITARAGALAGAAAAQRFGIWQKSVPDPASQVSPRYLVEISINVIASAIFSLLVIALNLIVPLRS